MKKKNKSLVETNTFGFEEGRSATEISTDSVTFFRDEGADVQDASGCHCGIEEEGSRSERGSDGADLLGLIEEVEEICLKDGVKEDVIRKVETIQWERSSQRKQTQ